MSTTDSEPFAAGAKVVIRTNPFHGADGEGIFGTVVRFEPRAGFMRADLAWVRYQLPRDGSEHELPFGTANLDLGDAAALLARAARHEEQAGVLRGMAEEAAR